MNDNDKKLIQNRYNERLNKYGENIEALASGTIERRTIRFDILTEIGIENGSSVLDVGCGFADFFKHLKEKNIDVLYTGIDIVPELIKVSKLKYPGLDLQYRDLQKEPFMKSSYDYVVCSQVFNLEMGSNSNEVLVKEMIKIMFKIARKGVAIDFLTSYVDFKQEHLHYYEPEKIISYSKKLTRRITLRHDYPLFEFCVYLFPTFDGWSKK